MKKLLFAFLVVAMVLMSVMPAFAAGPVTTTAQVNGAGSSPVIEAAWTLSYDPGPGLNDDPNVPGLQVTPALSASPTQVGTRSICVYAIVTHPNGIGAIPNNGVYIDVLHPDGSLKFDQLYLTRVNWPDNIAALIAAGLATGQLTNATALTDHVEKSVSSFWKVCWPYMNHQPAGDYQSVVTANDTNGNLATLTAFTTILGLYFLQPDFTAVNYGTIAPGIYKSVAGDEIWAPADGYPTIWNAGNINASLQLRWSAMKGDVYGKRLLRFDAMNSSVEPNQRVEVCRHNGDADCPTLANAWWSGWETLAGPYKPCTPSQIDFSITPQTDGEPIPVDTYRGQIELAFAAFPVPG